MEPFCVSAPSKTDKHGFVIFCSQVESNSGVFHTCSSLRFILERSSPATQKTPCLSDHTHTGGCSFEGFRDKLTCVSLEHLDTWA